MAVYHVSISGSKGAAGTAEHPFASINEAAQKAQSGDTVIIHGGVYREQVDPAFGGRNTFERITYKAAEGEKVVIKGSEEVTGKWQQLPDCPKVWKLTLCNCFFRGHNPYQTLLTGDWLIYPYPFWLHTGDVYLNGKSLYEAKTLDEVKNPQMREFGCPPGWNKDWEKIPHPEDTLLQWYTEADGDNTVIYANFGGADPNKECTEINVRPYCFRPSRIGINYLTLEGIEFAQAACNWNPPTGHQAGMVDTHWSKGWIVRNCEFHDAKTSGLSLGKEYSTGDCESERYDRKPGYQTQMETVFKAVKAGWSKETVGSHEVSHCKFHDCGENGIVGHLGCVFSHIHHNKFWNIATKYEYFGYEIAGIKLHAAVDVRIDHNVFHDTTLGIWLDWQAQGTRVSSNVFYKNVRDIMIEVTHGPCIVDNNVFASDYCFDNVAQGTAMINNIFNGATRRVQVLDRATPYHYAHSTDIQGVTFVFGGDDRLYNNIFTGKAPLINKDSYLGTAHYDGHTVTLEDYSAHVKAIRPDDHEGFMKIKDPVYLNHNVYMSGAKAFEREESKTVCAEDLNLKVYEQADGKTVVEFDLPEAVAAAAAPVMRTEDLGITRISALPFDDFNGQAIVFDEDILGQKRCCADTAKAGPFAGVKAGHNRFEI